MPRTRTRVEEDNEVAISVDLAKVMDYYAKDYKINGHDILKYEWAINPLTNKVIFVLTTRKK